MQMAYLISQESKCVSWKVGALIVKDGRVISTGYNGTPPGAVNCCDHAKEQGWIKMRYNPIPPHNNITILQPECRSAHSAWSAENEIHAELNAIIFAARNGLSIEGATLYTTLCPCKDCAKAIAVSGIKKLVYCEEYDKVSKDWYKILDGRVEIVKVEKSILNHLNLSEIQTYGGI